MALIEEWAKHIPEMEVVALQEAGEYEMDEMNRRMALAVKTVEQNGAIRRLYDFAWVMAAVNDGVVKGLECFCEGDEMNYTMLRRVFDEIYYAVEELAGKYPNEVMDPFKVKRINEILDEIRECLEDKKILPYLRLIDEPEETIDKEGKTIWKGLSYSDILLMLKWYKVLPR